MTGFKKMTPELRNRLCLIAKLLRDEPELHPSEVERVFGVGHDWADQMLDIAKAWVHRERVDHLLNQLHTGNLKGIASIGTLSGNKGKER